MAIHRVYTLIRRFQKTKHFKLVCNDKKWKIHMLFAHLKPCLFHFAVIHNVYTRSYYPHQTFPAPSQLPFSSVLVLLVVRVVSKIQLLDQYVQSSHQFKTVSNNPLYTGTFKIGYWQTVRTQMKCSMKLHLIWICTI